MGIVNRKSLGTRRRKRSHALCRAPLKDTRFPGRRHGTQCSPVRGGSSQCPRRAVIRVRSIAATRVSPVYTSAGRSQHRPEQEKHGGKVHHIGGKAVEQIGEYKFSAACFPPGVAFRQQGIGRGRGKKGERKGSSRQPRRVWPCAPAARTVWPEAGSSAAPPPHWRPAVRRTWRAADDPEDEEGRTRELKDRRCSSLGNSTGRDRAPVCRDGTSPGRPSTVSGREKESAIVRPRNFVYGFLHADCSRTNVRFFM